MSTAAATPTLLTALLLCACATDDRGEESFRVEKHKFGSYYTVELAPTGMAGVAGAATGAVLVPLLDDQGAQLMQGTNPIQASCGVTFVSPSHAVTAAHCVEEHDIPDPTSQALTVEMYAPMPDLQWGDHTDLLGSWPDFASPLNELDSSDGYHVETFDCELVVRCGTLWGTMIDCAHSGADVAVLECQGNPGEKYGFVDVATSDAPGDVVFMPWKHEVYSVDPDNAEHDDHYVDRSNPGFELFTTNYHYFEEVQRLPLFSRGEKHGDFIEQPRILFDAGDTTWTNLFGCHGTSGSGVMRFDSSKGQYVLLGPAAVGQQFDGKLCHPEDVDRDIAGLGYTKLFYTQSVTAFVDDCVTPRPRGDLLLWFGCHDTYFEESPLFDNPLLWPVAWGNPVEQFRVVNEKVVLFPQTQGVLEIPFAAPLADQTYRVSAHVVPMGSGLDAPVVLSIDGTDVAQLELGRGQRSGKLTAMFNATGGESISVRYAGDAPLGLTELTLVADGGVNTLDTMEARAGIAHLTESGVLEPMRFTRDRNGGFAANLLPGEPMAITRQAFTANRAGWSVAFETGDRTAALTVRAYDATAGVTADAVVTRTGDRVEATFAGIPQPVAVTVESDRATSIDNIEITAG